MEELEERACAEPPRRDRSLTAEREREVHGNRAGRDEDHDDRARDEARRDRRPNLLHADIRLIRAPMGRNREVAVQRVLDLDDLLAVRWQRGDREAAHLVAGRALLLHLRTQAPEFRVHQRSDLTLRHVLREADVDDVATFEIDAEVEAPEDDREDARDDDRERAEEIPVAVLHNVEPAVRWMLDKLLVNFRVQARVASDLPAEHPREQRARDRDRGEERDDDTDCQRDGESADDVRAEDAEDRARDQRRYVSVTNGRKCAAEA